MSQTIFWAKIRKKTSLPPSKGKTSFAKHPEICAFSQHNLCIKPKPHLAKSGPDRGSEVYQVGFWTSPSRFLQIAKPFLWPKSNKKRIYLLPKVKPHSPSNTKFVRLANTICAWSQNCFSPNSKFAEVSRVFVRQLLGTIPNSRNERVLKRFASSNRLKWRAEMMT